MNNGAELVLGVTEAYMLFTANQKPYSALICFQISAASIFLTVPWVCRVFFVTLVRFLWKCFTAPLRECYAMIAQNLDFSMARYQDQADVALFHFGLLPSGLHIWSMFGHGRTISLGCGAAIRDGVHWRTFRIAYKQAPTVEWRNKRIVGGVGLVKSLRACSGNVLSVLPRF